MPLKKKPTTQAKAQALTPPPERPTRAIELPDEIADRLRESEAQKQAAIAAWGAQDAFQKTLLSGFLADKAVDKAAEVKISPDFKLVLVFGGAS